MIEATEVLGSRELNLAPRNLSIREVAARLILDQTVGVVLEPGDMTRYRFLVSPGWAKTIQEAAGPGVGDDHLVVSMLSSQGRCYAITRGAVPSYIESKLGVSLYTASVISVFLSLLWAVIGEQTDGEG